MFCGMCLGTCDYLRRCLSECSSAAREKDMHANINFLPSHEHLTRLEHLGRVQPLP